MLKCNIGRPSVGGLFDLVEVLFVINKSPGHPSSGNHILTI